MSAIPDLGLVAGGIAIGGAIGAVTARKTRHDPDAQLVAAFHSLVGLAAVFAARRGLLFAESFGICQLDASNV